MPTQPNETVYKELSSVMRQELRDIYRKISAFSSGNDTGEGDAPNADALFTEATAQLDAVLEATENATMTIMGIVEKHLELQEESAAILEKMLSGARVTKKQKERLEEINRLWGQDLTNLLTSLSFQDITGQRIKKVVKVLEQIEKRVVDLYVSSGLIMEGAEKNPARNTADLRADAQKAVEDFRKNRKAGSALKGPDADGCSQGAIDDMLSQLGL